MRLWLFRYWRLCMCLRLWLRLCRGWRHCQDKTRAADQSLCPVGGILLQPTAIGHNPMLLRSLGTGGGSRLWVLA